MRSVACLMFALTLAACAPDRSSDPLKPPERVKAEREAAERAEAARREQAEREAAAGPAPDTPAAAATPAVSAARAPHIYMSLQPNDAGPVSIVFAIDAGKNNTPGDDPAIRLTPEDGKCNPQELRRFSFPAAAAQKPTFGPEQVGAGLTAKELPAFMATAVSAEMMSRKLVSDVEESKPQNVCTRKLWEQIIVNESLRAQG